MDERLCTGKLRREFEGPAANHRAGQHGAICLDLEPAQAFDPVEVDQDRRAGQPQREYRREALAARQQPCIITVLRQGLDCLIEAARGKVVERGGFHR